MVVRLELVGMDEIQQKLDKAVARFPDTSERIMRQMIFITKRRAKHYLDGPPTSQKGTRGTNEGLASQSGGLLKGLREHVQRSTGGVWGKLFDTTFYGKYWELDKYFPGGIRIIRPVRAKALDFIIDGMIITVKKVVQRGPRKFLVPALRDEEHQFGQMLATGHVDMIKGKTP